MKGEQEEVSQKRYLLTEEKINEEERKMIFFDDFVKKIEKREVALVGRHSFSLELKKKVVWLATGIPLLLMGIFQAYTGYAMGMKAAYFIFAVILAGLGAYHFKMAFSYRVVVDFGAGTLKNDKLNLKLEDIESAVLKRMVAPGSKKLQACIDVITVDRKEIIIPLIMTKKVEFTALLKNYLGHKFSVIKD